MSITVDVAATESHDAPRAPDTTTAAPAQRNRDRHRMAGHCDFCHAPLPLFIRLRTRRGWGFG